MDVKAGGLGGGGGGGGGGLDVKKTRRKRIKTFLKDKVFC